MKLKSALVGISALAALGALGGCTSPSAPQALSSEEASIAQGRHIAEVYCATCHAIGVSDPGRHPMAPPFRTLSEQYPLDSLEEAFAEGILVGHRDMPEFRLSPTQIDSLLAYLQSIQRRRGA